MASRSAEKEGEEALQELGQDSSASCGEDSGEAAVPLQPMKSMGDAEIYFQPI